MDELLDVVDVLADSELEGMVTWMFRVLGVLAILAGLGLWLFTDVTLFAPVVLVVVGLVLVAVPSVLVGLAELIG